MMLDLTLAELVAESELYANDRDGMEFITRVDEVAMAYRDGYRSALGEIASAIQRTGISVHSSKERKRT